MTDQSCVNEKRAIILLSGGLDSTTCLALAKHQGWRVWALSFDYAQRHCIELDAAKKIAKQYEVQAHYIVPIQLPDGHSSALTNNELTIPRYAPHQDLVPNTYVPARNTLFLSYALGLAETIRATSIWIGCSSVDYSGYPDCRPAFIEAYQQLANTAIPEGIQGQPVQIVAPLMSLSKAETIKLGLSLSVDYDTTISCYQATATKPACGECDSCQLRQQGFQQALS